MVFPSGPHPKPYQAAAGPGGQRRAFDGSALVFSPLQLSGLPAGDRLRLPGGGRPGPEVSPAPPPVPGVRPGGVRGAPAARLGAPLRPRPGPPGRAHRHRGGVRRLPSLPEAVLRVLLELRRVSLESGRAGLSPLLPGLGPAAGPRRPAGPPLGGPVHSPHPRPGVLGGPGRPALRPAGVLARPPPHRGHPPPAVVPPPARRTLRRPGARRAGRRSQITR